MKAVNLIPSEGQGTRGAASLSPRSPALIPLGLLAVALALVTVYVLTQNSISSRKVKLASVQAQLTAVQSQAARLTQYTQFEQLAQARIQTIKQIATSRFDWYAALSDLSKVVPANTSLQSMVGTVSAGTSATSTSGSTVPTSQSLRASIDAPAIAIAGCTKSHDDVARLISRLRVMRGVTRVTLSDSMKVDGSQGGATVSSGSAAAGGCGQQSPSFDLIVFFKPLPGASTTSSVGSPSTSVSTNAASSAASAAGSTTPAAGATTTPAAGATATPAAGTTTTPTSATTSPTSSAPATGGSR